jgi:cytosine/adenosine deaminase-related metal-dependent hydrolase
MASSMLGALRFAFLSHRDSHRDPRIGFEVHPGLLAATSRAAGHSLGKPLLGDLTAGAPADIAVIDAPPPTPIEPENVFGHLVYGAAHAPVRHTVARGKVLMRDFELLTVDLEETAREARGIAPRVWERFHALPAPTS